MKKLILAISFLIVLNCGSTKTEKPVKIKTFETEELTVSYPSSWIKTGGVGYIYFIPKIIKKSTFENEVENVSVNKHFIPINSSDEIERVLKKYANTKTRNELSKSFQLIKLTSSSKFIYKIESLITYNFTSETYKREEYFLKKSGKLEYFTYQMRETLFEKYHDDAMLIINSIQEKN